MRLRTRIEALADPLQRLGNARSRVGEGTYGREPCEQARRVYGRKGGMPKVRRDMMLQRGDPLRRVLRRARRFDDPLVIVAGRTGESHLLAATLRLLGLLCGLCGLASPIAVIDRVPAALHVLSSRVRQVTSVRKALPRHLQTSAVRDTKSHLATPASRCGVSKDPCARRVPHTQQQSAAVCEVSVSSREKFARCQPVKLRRR